MKVNTARDNLGQRTHHSSTLAAPYLGFPGSLSPGEESDFPGLFRAITSFHQILDQAGNRSAFLRAVVDYLARRCGCRCVGIRLAQGDGLLPFAVQAGFNSAFVARENRHSTAARKRCCCLRIFSGRARQSDRDWSTPRGSFCCNRLRECINQLAPAHQTGRTLPCRLAGYQSVAQTPIRYRDQLVGTLHLADPRPGRISVSTLALLETVAPLIGEALHRFGVEESLAESELRFKIMFERHGAVMLLVCGKTGAIIDANPAAAAFYGYPREQLRRMHIAQLHTPPSTRRPRWFNSHGIDVRAPLLANHRLANGQVRPVEVFGSAIKLRGRHLVFAVLHDISERKILEKAILNLGEKERERVGRDLHDSLGGKLTGTALIAKALARQLAARTAPETALADEIVHDLQESIQETRAIAHGLSSAELASTSLTDAIQSLAAEIRRLPGIDCQFSTFSDIHIEDAFVATNLFRIAREAINNALRHGDASHIDLSLEKVGKRLRLEIRDNGTGLNADKLNGNGAGLGLHSMKYRAAAMGGELSVRRNRPHGTIVTCWLPLNHLSAPKDRPT